jgi:hypothetical protein
MQITLKAVYYMEHLKFSPEHLIKNYSLDYILMNIKVYIKLTQHPLIINGKYNLSCMYY